jgi:hypothetical protein
MKPKTRPQRIEAFARVLMLSNKRPEQYALLKRIGGLAERRPEQWGKLKEFLRTGKKPEHLRLQTVKDFSKPMLDYVELVNKDRRRPYTGRFSREERREIRRQVRDVVDMLMPRASEEHKERTFKSFCGKMTLVQRRHVEKAIKEGNFSEIFDRGQMYLDSLGRGNITKAERRGLEPGAVGVKEPEFVMRDRWMRDRYDRTTPFHEASHFLISQDEFRTHIADYYYSLKRGFMGISDLRGYRLTKRQKAARSIAIRLFEKGKSEGWGKAEVELRGLVYGKKRR